MGDTCSHRAEEDNCVNAWISTGQGNGYPAHCLWCIGYKNATGINQCVHDNDYCANNDLCQTYEVFGDLDCDWEINYLQFIFYTMGITVPLAVCILTTNIPDDANTMYRVSVGLCLFLSLAFFGVSLWAGITMSAIAMETWFMFACCSFYGPILIGILSLLIPFLITAKEAIQEYVTRPVSARVLASLVYIIPCAMAANIVVVLVEISINRDLIAFGAEWSLIVLGFDWALLVFEYQTEESKRKAAKWWCRITFREYNLNEHGNMDVYLAQRNEIIEESETEEQKYPANKLLVSRCADEKKDSRSQLIFNSDPIDRDAHDNEAGIQLLVIWLLCYVTWMTGWIVWACANEDKEPCLMNIATAGPVIASISKRIHSFFHDKDTLCCCCCGGLFFCGIIIMSIVSCLCEGDHEHCGRMHLIVIIMVNLWSWLTFVDHFVIHFLKSNDRQGNIN